MFRFKQFEIEDNQSTMKVCTDSVILGAWVAIGEAERILDIGTGCGLLSLMCAQRSKAWITGIDIHFPSIEQAQENFKKSRWKNRLKAKHIALEDYEGNSFDYIITNPPFFINSLKVKNPVRNLARHTDEFRHKLMLVDCKRLLNDKGSFGIILPVFEARYFEEMAMDNGFIPKRKLFVSSKEGYDPYLVLAEYSLSDRACQSESLSIHPAGMNSYTQEYRRLTEDFYLNF
ncbi:MAG TPA: methyltransferase [Bacteroidales bacterium]|nr:methyltransferase [Bacteroidales bacterium]MDI9573126.1 methyltransferase [Bacteroidota bacterium]MBP9512478.1 methyltransferase [Bacteroidales bacterium]MBP9588469.1 methyltransferase [Bacteroidales bacterium]NMD15552.1 methyltransferase [Bacteroidales bacterium]